MLKHAEFMREYESLDMDDPNKTVALMKLRKCEETMKDQWFKQLQKDGKIKFTPEMGKPSYKTDA